MSIRPKIFPFLFFLSFNVFAQAEIPFNTPQNSIEYKAAGNTYTWQPVTGETPRPAQPYRPDLSGGSVSSVEPKAKWSPQLPYEHKGGPTAKMTVTGIASKAAIAGAAAKELAKGAIACGAKPGNPLVVSAQIAGCMGGGLLIGAAIDWGFHKLNSQPDGSFTASVPAGDYETSTGNLYFLQISGQYFEGYSYSSVCSKFAQAFYGSNPGLTYSVSGANCSGSYRLSDGRIWPFGPFSISSKSGTCPAGHYVANGVCSSQPPTQDLPLESAISAEINKPWGIAQANVMAGVMMAGHNIFTDGTGTTITGPNTVPLGVSSESMPVNVIPGTTTIAPPEYSGATEPGTQTTTTTKTANNSYSGNKQTTSTGTNTITTVTNNITNVTNITNETSTEKDEAPAEVLTDTPFADLPELYKQKYPDGLIGVLRTQTAAMKATPLFQLPMQLMGDLPQTGQCPSWQLDLSLASWASFGTYNVGADCAIWDFAGWVIVISAFILARQLIFGG